MTLQRRELLVLLQIKNNTDVNKFKSPHCEGYIEKFKLIYKKSYLDENIRI